MVSSLSNLAEQQPVFKKADLATQRKAWQAFVSRRVIDPSVPDLIARSWMRCYSLLDPHQRITSSRLGSEHLLSTQVANFELLLIARPIMEDLYQYIEGSSTAVMITNSAGYILDILGDTSILAQLNAEGINRGISLAENQVGTNSFALALHERMSVQVSGPEHYLERLHHYASSAAPVFDLTGNPLGAVGIINFQQHHHAHSLGLVTAGARAIESQRQADHLMDEQNRQLASLNAILASIGEGILVWNSEQTIIHANPAATAILHMAHGRLMGQNVAEILQMPVWLQDALQHNRAVSDVEATLHNGDQSINCVISLRYIPDGKESSGAIAILRSPQEVRQLIYRQLGAQASFSLDNLVGNSAQMRRLRRTAETAAAARASILVRGETGTGKNLMARAIHSHGPQREGPFIVFACTAIPGELVVSELVGIEEDFNHLRNLSRPGKIELADGGTIFFKDVEALPLEAQTILVNMLELGIVQRLGSRMPINVLVRVIASSSANLETLVESGSFRPDLYYRLSPFEILIPPLRERLEDLPLLVQNILERINRYQYSPITAATETIALLCSYSWPGNIRELEGVLERAVAGADNSTILLPQHLPDLFRHITHPDSSNYNISSLDEIERQALLQAARICHGNLTHMARALGIGRTTVWRRLKEMDISLDQYRSS